MATSKKAYEKLVEQAKSLPRPLKDELIRALQPARKPAKLSIPWRKGPLGNLEGLWKGHTITEEDIAQARREMWGNFGKRFDR